MSQLHNTEADDGSKDICLILSRHHLPTATTQFVSLQSINSYTAGLSSK